MTVLMDRSINRMQNPLPQRFDAVVQYVHKTLDGFIFLRRDVLFPTFDPSKPFRSCPTIERCNLRWHDAAYQAWVSRPWVFPPMIVPKEATASQDQDSIALPHHRSEDPAEVSTWMRWTNFHNSSFTICNNLKSLRVIALNCNKNNNSSNKHQQQMPHLFLQLMSGDILWTLLTMTRPWWWKRRMVSLGNPFTVKLFLVDPSRKTSTATPSRFVATADSRQTTVHPNYVSTLCFQPGDTFSHTAAPHSRCLL